MKADTLCNWLRAHSNFLRSLVCCPQSPDTPPSQQYIPSPKSPALGNHLPRLCRLLFGLLLLPPRVPAHTSRPPVTSGAASQERALCAGEEGQLTLWDLRSSVASGRPGDQRDRRPEEDLGGEGNVGAQIFVLI